MKLSARLFAPATALLLAACATAAPGPGPAPVDPSMAGPGHTRLTGYLRSGAVDAIGLLGPPPAMDSARGRADQEAFDTTRSQEGSPRWLAAQRDNDLWNGAALSHYACALGHEISAARTPTTLRILERMELDVRTVGSPAKDFYKRRRPAIGNDKPICIPREPWLETNGSYPSGHSATGWSWALVLAELAPARTDAVLAVGREMGESRVVCGVHYPSDIEAGRTVASAMVARLHAEPAFTDDMAKARRELAAAPAPANCAP